MRGQPTGQQVTNPNLKPETSKSYTVASSSSRQLVQYDFDWYHIKIDDQIVSGGPQITVRSSGLTPLLQYQPSGLQAGDAAGRPIASTRYPS